SNRSCQRRRHGFPLHLWKRSYLKRFQDGRSNIVQPQSCERCRSPALREILALRHDKDSIPIVICSVWPGVVFFAVDFTAPHHAARTPVEIAEEDAEIGRDIARMPIHFLRENDPRTDRIALGVAQSFELLFQPPAQNVVVRHTHSALWFTSLD